MNALYLVLLLLAAFLFTLATLGIRSPRVNLVALGLLCWVLVPLIQTGRSL